MIKEDTNQDAVQSAGGNLQAVVKGASLGHKDNEGAESEAVKDTSTTFHAFSNFPLEIQHMVYHTVSASSLRPRIIEMFRKTKLSDDSDWNQPTADLTFRAHTPHPSILMSVCRESRQLEVMREETRNLRLVIDPEKDTVLIPDMSLIYDFPGRCLVGLRHLAVSLDERYAWDSRKFLRELVRRPYIQRVSFVFLGEHCWDEENLGQPTSTGDNILRLVHVDPQFPESDGLCHAASLSAERYKTEHPEALNWIVPTFDVLVTKIVDSQCCDPKY